MRGRGERKNEMSDLFQRDQRLRPDLFIWNGPLYEGLLSRWLRDHGLAVNKELFELWRDTGGGEIPENINIDHPAPGTYRLSVYVWSWRAGRDVQDLRDRVRIYCGGSLVYETASSPLTFDRALWRIADITIEEDGRCRVEPLPVIAEPMSRSEQMPR